MGKVWDVLAPRNLELGPLAGHERAGSPWRNFMLARDEDGIAWLALDKANASANTLSEDVLAELNDVLASLAMPSSSRASIQLRQGEPARSRPASGPSSRLRGARTSQTLPIYGIFICAGCIITPRARCALALRSGERVASPRTRAG